MALDPFSKKQLNYRSYIHTIRALYQKPVAQKSTALILTLSTIAFFGFAAIKPTLGTVSELQAELKEKKELDKEITAKLSALNEIQDLYSTHEDTITIFDRVIPADKQLEDILLKLEYLAYQNQTPLQSLRFVDLTAYGETSDMIQAGELYPSLQVDLTVHGSYGELTQLLGRFDNLDRYLRIEAVNFRQPTDEEATYELIMGVRLRLYWSDSQSSQAN